MKKYTDEFYLSLAVREAKKSIKNGCYPFGCIIVNKENMVVGKAGDRVNKYNNVTKHCVMTAINLACKYLKTTDLSDCKMYCVAEPCNMCKGAIQNAKIPEIIYVNDRDDITAIGLGDLASNHIDYKEYTTKAECAKKIFAEYVIGNGGV